MENKPQLKLLSNLHSNDGVVRIKAQSGERSSKMEANDSVTRKDLQHLEETTNMKLENIKIELKGEFNTMDANMNGKFNTLEAGISGKFNTLESQIKNMFLEQKQSLDRERKEDRKFIVATGVGIVAALAAILTLFF